MSGHDDQGHPQGSELAAFLRSKRDLILAQWEQAARATLPTDGLSRPRLLDALPELLDTIANSMDHAAQGGDATIPHETAERHALSRLDEGFDLTEVVAELSLLRDCIVRLRSERSLPPGQLDEQRLLDQALDRTIVASVERYTAMRDRILRALDRISTMAFEVDDLDTLLRQLLDVFAAETAAVDTAMILLHDENDYLVVRAASGLEEDHTEAMPVGEGFAGTIAAQRRPLELTDAATDPLVRVQGIRQAGVKALFGVPLIADGKVIGVAHMGSLTAPSFSDQDRLLFSSMASRATAAIYQQLLRDAAARRASELAVSERRFRDTFENAAVGIAHLAPDGRWLRLNQKYLEILGYDESELRALTWQALTHPDDLERESECVHQLLAGELDRHALEKRFLRKDGEAVWVHLTASLMRDDDGAPMHFISVAQDISQRKRGESQLALLAQASRLLASTLDYARTLEHVTQLVVPDLAEWCAIDLLRADGQAIELVAVAHRDRERIEQVRALRTVAPPVLDAPVGVAKVIRTGEPELAASVDEALLRRHARSEAHLALALEVGVGSYAIVPLTVAGRTFGALTMVGGANRPSFSTDDLAFLEELAHRCAAAIDNARLHEQTHQAVGLREQLLALVSHDLRNPLSTVGLSASVLAELAEIRTSAQATRKVAAIQRAVARMNRLIDDLLDMSSIEAGRLSLSVVACPIAPILSEALDAHETLAQERDITLRRSLALDGAYVSCDRDRLLQVLGNLLGNALKFCRPGDTVTLVGEASEHDVVMSVVDTGPGIAPQDLPHIFELYWKREHGGSHGTGLGLFITRGIVEAHGGRIAVHSQPGAGTTFTVALPRSAAPEPHPSSD